MYTVFVRPPFSCQFIVTLNNGSQDKILIRLGNFMYTAVQSQKAVAAYF